MEPLRPQPGIAASLRAGLGAGAVCGLLFGLADGLVAAFLATPRPSTPALLGCLSAAVLQYSLICMAALALLGCLAHPFLRRRAPGARYLFALRVGLAAGLAAQIYWWTRPFVFYGRSATSPERLLSAAGMVLVAAVAAWYSGAAVARAPQAAKRGIALLAGVAWIAGGLFLLFQIDALGSRGRPNERTRDLPNVLLVIVDALRQDALGCYGNARVKTPHVDRLAAEGVLFENAFTQAPFTWSSFGSILTGKYPRRHGLLKMKPGVRMPQNETLPLVLETATKTDGTRLEEGDFLAATFHTGTLTDASGLLAGFDLRYEATAGHDLVVLDNPWSVYRAYLLVWILRDKVGQRFELGGTAAEAQRFVAEHGDRRFLAMVHLYSTHTPYDPPEEFWRMYCDPSYAGPIRSFWAEHRKLIESGKYVPTAADVRQIRDLYHAGVSQADAQIGALVEELARQRVLDDTLIIVTSDHGESLGEQDLWEHDHMVQTNLRIPLVMRWPKGLPANRRVSALVDEIDVLPTVCDLLDISLPREPIDGESLVPLVRGEKETVRQYSFAENGPYLSVQDRRWKLVVPRAALSEAPADKERPVLFDLATDPNEEVDQFTKSPDEAERLLAVLREWNEKLPIPPDSVIESARDIENQARLLEKLGYTAGRSDGSGQ